MKTPPPSYYCYCRKTRNTLTTSLKWGRCGIDMSARCALSPRSRQHSTELLFKTDPIGVVFLGLGLGLLCEHCLYRPFLSLGNAYLIDIGTSKRIVEFRTCCLCVAVDSIDGEAAMSMSSAMHQVTNVFLIWNSEPCWASVVVSIFIITIYNVSLF
jgi:hypothetical protein